ncbi:MAG: Ig-like domain-containing protein [Verrucomicrobia bacterium]|nr:Ig-like domain-containing protein [Verrucomicrobiota bacterium]
MKPLIPFRLTSILSLTLLAGIVSLRAEFIQPVAVQASNGQASQDTLINGQGFDADPGIGSPTASHNRLGGEMWSGIGSIKEYVVFDLGKAVSLTKVFIWNYNVQNATDVGMKDVEVQVSSDTNMTNANFNAIAQISLKEGGEAAQVFNVVGTSVRLVKLKGLSNWGQGYTVGLAEVRFESGDLTGNVPSIVLNSPRDGDEIAFGADITIDARVTDKDGTADLQKIEFFDGNTLVTNKTTSAFSAVLKGAAKGDHALRIVATDKSGKAAWVTANVFVRELVADRIVKIDDTADEGDGLYQIKYSGSWNLAPGGPTDPRYNHNDHYNLGTGRTDSFEVRFKGVKIDVYGTVASHHGTGMASIDGGPESKVNYKTPQRAEQVFVWGSPILPNREHVLKIRVAGDGVVTADRFDVHVSDKPEVTTATLKEVLATFTSLVVKMEDAPSSVVDPATVKLTLDGTSLAASVVRAPPITTITHTPATPFQPGSTHVLKVEAKDLAGASITNQATFTLPAPFFPLTGLDGPLSTAGNWGFRQIWNAGRADALVSAVSIALQAKQSGFSGKFHDTAVPSINFAKTANPGGGGLIPDDRPLPAESQGLPESDFVIVARAKVKIPRSGDWTIGVHSDEGFGLRFIGASFASVSGVGRLDDNFPEFMVAQNNTGDSNTRGILKNLPAGTYEIEFISWERVGAAYCEVYAAEGAFADDAETDQWKLIGAPDGLQIVAGANLAALGARKENDRVIIDFISPNPDGQHQLQESADLKTWQPVTGVTFQKIANGVRASVNAVTADRKFYRGVLP